MSVRNGIVLLLALSTLMFLAGCGSGSPKAVAPPGGAFGNGNLNGTYVFSFSGTDVSDAVNGVQSFFAVAGTLSANGSGGFTGGTIDIDDPALAAAVGASSFVQTGLAATGSYKITPDGRGSGTITVTVDGTQVPLGLDFVLSSGSHGLITRFDGGGTGSGTIDLQSGSVAQGGLGSYAFSLSGIDEGLVNPFASAGAFTLNSSGTITAGLQDFNDDRNSSSLTSLPLTGSVLLGSAGAAGTAQLATGSPFGTLSFDVWPIDATHLKLIETDGVAILEGDAFTQQTSISAGQLVYTMAGLDLSNNLLSAGGFLTYDGSSVISNGLEDINDGGSIAQSLTVSGTLTATAGGRFQLGLGGFFNGGAGASTFTFAAYPFSSGSSSGILLLEIDSLGVTAGTAFAQTATTFGSSQGYGLNLTGANSDGEVDDIAQFIANSGGVLNNGLIDENDQGLLSFDQQLGSGGTYAFDSGATGRGLLSYPGTDQTLIGTLNLEFYVANSSTVVFIDVDSGAQAGVGSFLLQSASSASPALAQTASHLSMLQTAAALRARRRN